MYKVGKSCLRSRFMGQSFERKHQMTVGTELVDRWLTVEGAQCKVNLWDTSGQTTLRSLSRRFYESATGFIIVYDVCDRDTFDWVPEWLSEVTKISPQACITLIGNKKDETRRREVESSEGARFASRNGLLFQETSAKENENVDDAFEELARKVIQKIEQGNYNLEDANLHGIKVGRDRRELNLKGTSLKPSTFFEHLKALLTCEACKNPAVN